MRTSSFLSAPSGPSRRPGILELYKSTLLYCRLYARPLAAAAACVLVPFLLAELLFSGVNVADVLRQLDSAQDPQAALAVLRSTWRVFAAWGVWLLVESIVVQPLLLGTLARICRSVWYTGRPLPTGVAFPAALRRLGMGVATLIVQAIVAGLAGAVVAAAVSLVLAGLGAAGVGWVLTGVVATLVGIAGGVAWLWLAVRLSQALPVSLLEHGGPLRALARSWQITRRATWYIVGFTVLALATAGAVQWLLGILGTLSQSGALAALFGAVANLLTQPYLALAHSQLYLSLTAAEEDVR